MSKKTAFNYFCGDCLLPSTVYKLPAKGKKYVCPYCGDSVEVSKYEGLHRPTGEKGKKIRWQPQELEIIEDVIEGKKTQMQAAHILGRSVHSVQKKVARTKEEYIFKKL